MTDPDKTVENFRRAIKADTRLIVCTHASNVWGTVLPIRQIGALAREYGIPFCVDAAQSAGVIPIDMQRDNIDFLCTAGHKGLYGPMGTGMLISSGEYRLPSFAEGGTGSRSMEPMQPAVWPDHMESGTPNTAGICGLCAGMEWVTGLGVQNIGKHETDMAVRLYRGVRDIDGMRLYTPPPAEGRFLPVVSFNLEGIPSEQVAKWLDDAGIAVRAGLHCAPLAHRKMGTEKTGTVRLAPSVFTTSNDVGQVCKILRQTARKALQYS
jgi:selenocysteine lyase/cysteine desulfurase